MSIYGRRRYTKTVDDTLHRTLCWRKQLRATAPTRTSQVPYEWISPQKMNRILFWKISWKFVRRVNFSRKITSCFCSQNFAEKARAFTKLTTQNEILFREIHLNSVIAAIHNLFTACSIQFFLSKELKYKLVSQLKIYFLEIVWKIVKTFVSTSKLPF